MDINVLKERVEALERWCNENQEEIEDRLDFLEEEMLARLEEKAAPSTQRLNVFNPQVTVFGNFTGRGDSKEVRNEEGDSIDNRFNLREVEIDFRAVIDPWADGVVITAFESEGGSEFIAEIEEGYAIIKRLPILDISPWGLKLKVGRFRPEFGRFNKIHTHDLPQTTLPLASRTFLGGEGFIQTGLSGQFFFPFPWEKSVIEATIEVLNGGGLPVAAGNEEENLSFLGHVKLFTDLAPGHDLEVGGSSYLGLYDELGSLESRLYGIDFTYKWRPFEGGEWRSFLLGGELFIADVEGMTGSGREPFGYFIWSQYQFNRQAYLGFRYDRTEEISNDLLTRSLGIFLSYYTTEFLRFRTGYEHADSDDSALDGLDTVYFELNFVFGSHPVEPYWVNR
jgi:hypothetical protein